MASGIFTQRQVQREMIRGSWANLKTPAVEYLVVAGGGGGGGSFGGGGGAGGLLQGIIPVTNSTSYTVTVGSGGTAGVYNAGSPTIGANGTYSAFSSITSTGGGAGGAYNGQSGLGGGSGGGTGSSSGSAIVGGKATQFGQGNNGGTGGVAVAVNAGAGGGGAGTVGQAGSGDTSNYGGYAGDGGSGISSSISGTVTTYAGGGGGGGYSGSSVPAGVGGAGGGGAGGYTAFGTATAGTTNTGGGGGGGDGAGIGGAGGSGIVIVSYPDVYANAVSQTNATYSTSGSGSLSFSGSSQYISYTSNAAFALPSDFTLEMWIYPLNWTATNILPYTTYPGTDGGLLFGKYGSNFVIRAGNVADQLTYGTLPTVNAWTHIVAVRSGTTLSMYYNGTRVATTTNSYSFAQALLKIGSDGYGSDFPGYISNVRLVKGAAVYNPSSTTLTVPIAPLTAINGTSILLNTVSGSQFTDSSTNSFTPTLTGTPSWNQLSPFTSTGYKNRVYTWTSSGTITF